MKSDEEAFEEWWKDFAPDWSKYESRATWEVACAYARADERKRCLGIAQDRISFEDGLSSYDKGWSTCAETIALAIEEGEDNVTY